MPTVLISTDTIENHFNICAYSLWKEEDTMNFMNIYNHVKMLVDIQI